MTNDIFNSLAHITNRAQNREKFHLPMDQAWNVACDRLRFTVEAYKIDLHLFLMMDNHVHMIASAPHNNLSQAMRYFFGETSRTMNKRSSRINHTWGQRHRQTKIKSYFHYLNAYKYGYRNPVAAKMVERVEDYPYSSLRGLIGIERSILLVKDDLLFSGDLAAHLRWLNTAPLERDLECMRIALRRKVFKLPKIDSRPNALETKLL